MKTPSEIKANGFALLSRERRDSSPYCPACGVTNGSREVPEATCRQRALRPLPRVAETQRSHKPQAGERRRRRKEEGGRSGDFQVPLAPCRWVQLTAGQKAALLASPRAEIYCLPWKSQAKQQHDGMGRSPSGCKESRLRHLAWKRKGGNGGLETSVVTGGLPVPLTPILSREHFI